ncbi:hypothetical protein StoSoilA2_21070 [Arthrobacter sp. StoSoilA2]|nr:hypothetical protein StoSoilA2_21070 [Arthrobacter sp. StoSoilA2]
MDFALAVSILALIAAALSALYARKQAFVAHSASRAQSLLSILDYLQRTDIRDSRRKVLTVLANIPVSKWTDDQRATASNASASYDLVGTLLRNGVVDREPIIQNYGASIIRCHAVCKPMIDGFRSQMSGDFAQGYWKDFDWLAEEARKLHSPKRSPQ